MLQTNILFADVTNNGRSILAEAYFNQHSRGGLRAFSAGTRPDDALDKHIFEVLRENNISPDDYCPKPFDIFLQPYSPRIDLVVGFTPSVEAIKLPIMASRPDVTHLDITPVSERMAKMSRKQAVRDCFDDMCFVIDRALASGQLPSKVAA